MAALEKEQKNNDGSLNTLQHNGIIPSDLRSRDVSFRDRANCPVERWGLGRISICGTPHRITGNAPTPRRIHNNIASGNDNEHYERVATQG